MKHKSNKKSLSSNVSEHITAQSKTQQVARLNTQSRCSMSFFNVLQNRLSKIAAFTLFISLALQPFFAQAEEDFLIHEAVPASESDISDEDETEVQLPAEVEEIISPPISSENVSDNEQSVSDEESDDESPNAEDVNVEESSVEEPFVVSNPDEIQEEASSSTASVTATTTEDISVDTDNAENTTVEESDEVEENNATTTPENIDFQADSDTENAEESPEEGEFVEDFKNDQSTTTKADEPTVVTVVHTDTAFSFEESECTVVNGGSYYCQRDSEVTQLADDLFAAPDKDGDLEIFMRREGVEIQLTNNVVDDASPHYDATSNTVVWHRLHDDRYQIIEYDIETGEEFQLTNTRVNNMEPTRSGHYIVWQRWLDHNWEVVLYNSKTGVETVVTDSPAHDIAPNIRGDLVIWNVRNSDGSQILRTYEITSGVHNEITDPDGVAVSNPRMVVVYDAQYANGDTITKGFDLFTGELVPLEQVPRDLPEELPSPESTGEVSALVAPTLTKPEFDESESDSDDDISDDDQSEDVFGTLDISSSTVSIIETQNATTSSDLEVPALDLSKEPDQGFVDEYDPEFDLVIPAELINTSTSTHISEE